MKSLPRLFAALVFPLFVLCVLTGCSGPTTPGGKTLKSIAVTPATPASIKVGATQQFTATGTFSDSTTADISSTVTWTSGTPATATISATGLATGVAAGTTQITASNSGVTSPAVTLTVTVATLTSIAVTPATPASLKVGATQQFTATGTFSDSTTADISSTVTWTSGTPATATISSTGLATGVAAGTTQITASKSGVTSPAVTLKVISLASIAVTPNPASVAVAGTVQFTATGTYSDASTANITTQVTWASAPTSVATIGAATGLATGVANGTSQITATLGTVVSPAVTLTVGTSGTPVPIAVKIVQVNPTIAVGAVEDFTAKFLLSDGTTVAPTAAVTWSSGTTATASIIANSGIASGLAAGTSTITAASAGLTSGTTLLTVKPAVSRFAYVSGLNDVATAGYVVNAAANTLMPFGVLRDTLKPAQVVPEPSGRFAYAIGANSAGTIGVYTIDPVTGLLTNTNTGFTALNVETGPFQAITNPTGRFLYVANSHTNNVSAMQINSVDGTLSCLGTPAPAPPCTATSVGTFPVGLAEDRLGKFLYVSNNTDGTISGFSVGVNGSLTPLSTPTFPTGSSPFLPAIDPSNSFLYVPNNGDGTISVFSIHADGTLTAVGSPVPVGSGALSGPAMIVIDPSNKFLYVTLNGDKTVVGLTIGAGGTLGVLGVAVPGSPFSTGSGPVGIAMDAAGAFLVVVNQNDNTLTYYSLNSTTGALTAGGTVQTRPVPQLVNLYTGIASPVITPKTVEAANSGTSNDISSYTVNAGTGALTAAATSPTAGVAGNSQVAVTQTGTFFYTASTSALKLGAFSVNGSAALTALTGSPADLGGDTPAGVYADPSGQFVYVGDSKANVIIDFTNSSGTISTGTHSASLGSVNAIAGDAQGSLIFALGAAQIQPAIIDSANGSLTVLTGGSTGVNTLSLAGNWTAGAVDASGLFLVAVNSTGHNIQSFAITPVTGNIASTTNCTVVPFADGCLTPGGSVAAGSNGPYAITFDPLNRFVFLADLAAGTVKTFTFDATTGALTAGSSTAAAANGVTNVAVDATGTYLYVGLPGASVSTPSSVAVYTISSSTGALTAVGSPIVSGTKTAGVTVTNSVN
jgi:6-phosphogluconolactonase (cycloisomerase 2 family)